jgi:4-amino-4-deoxy-L-arabinose transferase-like glycosyltransferase
MKRPFLPLLNGWLSLAFLVVVLALVAYLLYFVVYTRYAVALFQFPFDYDQGEGFELLDTILFSRGQWPYRDIESYPFYSSNYPPVYHLVIVPLVWLFGPHYWTGRLVTYLGTLVTAGLIGYAVQRETRRWWVASLAGLAFLGSNYVYHVGPLFRQHMFMVMLETAAVVLVAEVIKREEETGTDARRGLLMVMVLLLLAGYTKQLAYATVITVFIFLFLRSPKRSGRWAVPLAVATGAIFSLMNSFTDGHWLVNTVSANVNPFVPGQAIGLYRQWFGLHLVITLVAGAMLLYQLYFERVSVYAIWFAVAAVNGVTAGKWGAGESYFATAIAASCILTGLALGRLVNWTQHRRNGAYPVVVSLVAVLFLVQAELNFHLPTDTPFFRTIARTLGKPAESMVAPQTSCSAPQPPVPVPYVDSAEVGLLGRPPTPADVAAGQRISAMIAAGETAAFSEEAGFNLYVGRDVVTNPTQLLNLYNNGQVDLTEMLEMLDERAFDTVIFRAQFYPPPVLEVIGRHYETTSLIEMNGFVYCVLTPRAG